LHVGIGADGVEALVLAHLRRYFAGDRHRDVRELGAQHRAEPFLVHRIAVAVQEADGDGLVAAGRDRGDDGLGFGLVERHERLATGVEPLRDRESVLAFDQGRGQDDVDVVLLEPTLRARLDHVAKAGGGDESGPGAASLDECVGGEGGAVDDLLDLGEIHAGFGCHLTDAVEDSSLRRVVGGEHLGGVQARVGALDDDVGERSPDVGTDARVHVYKSSIAGNSEGGLMSTVAERCWASMPPSTLITSPVM
jgi:hypothetical protein